MARRSARPRPTTSCPAQPPGTRRAIGKLACPRIVEIYGPESSGKTTLALHAIASIQRQGGTAAFIDAAHALDVTYAKKLGVKTDEMLISQPDYGEQALEIADMLVRSNAVDVIVVDSEAALVPKAEIEGEMGDAHMGLQARLTSQALRALTSVAYKCQHETLSFRTGQAYALNMPDYFFTRECSQRGGRFVLTVLIDEELRPGIRRRKSSFHVEYDTAKERDDAAAAWTDDRLKGLSAFF